ncbi:DarT ssDNA thymidine ADP-ribosyltransferase family protein [Pseudomonadota bacterium]
MQASTIKENVISPECKCLYHFTDERNLDSIREHGLLSWPLLLQTGIAHVPASSELSRELDARHGLENYVRLCLTRYHPMLNCAVGDPTRIFSRPTWIRVHPAVIRWETTLFSDMNATANLANIGDDPWIAFNSGSSQAEVMVLGRIEPKYLALP